MSRNIREKGTHTWDLHLHYHTCPSCGYIIESREGYNYRLGANIKELICSRCGHAFAVKKVAKPTVGPLFGEGSHPEMEWRDE